VNFVKAKSFTMIQLYIPLVGLVIVLAYYFIAFEVKFIRRINNLKKMRKDNIARNSGIQYYKWELHELI